MLAFRSVQQSNHCAREEFLYELQQSNHCAREEFLYELQGGPAGGRLRRPSSRRQDHGDGLDCPHMTDQPPVAIRPLTTADASTCDDIIRSLPYHFGDTDGQRECAEAVRNSPGLVAIRDDQVVGFLTIAHHFESTTEITWMAVHARHRGQGIGRALVRRLSDQLRREGRRLLLVTTLSSLEAEPGVVDGYNRTRAFYRSVGFIPARELPNLWPNHSALLLAMPLDHA
jgi:ribosomal protein S18 acetylase RimI-like enzyme